MSDTTERQQLLSHTAGLVAALGEKLLDYYIEQENYDPSDPETREAARAEMLDPANHVMCETCGWTYGMVCPECAKGCGCEYSCSGWRHGEWNAEDDDPENGEPCWNCGTPGCPGYCDDYQTYNLRDADDESVFDAVEA